MNGGPVRAEASSTKDAKAPSPRRRAISFVVVFLACTFALLVGYRYAGGTTFMDWYLFQIARQTSAALSVFGYSSELESPETYDGRAAEIRAQLRAMTGAPAGAAPADNRPLSSWDAWRYRALKTRQNARGAERALAAIETLPWSPPEDPAQRIPYLRDRLAKVESALRIPGMPATAPVPDPDSAAAIVKLNAALDTLAPASGLGPDDLARQTAAIEAGMRALEARAVAILTQRAMQLGAQAREDGPRVSYVAKAGAARRVRDLNARIEATRNDLSLEDAAKQSRIAELEAQVAALQPGLSDPQAQKDVAFTFRVVADCGAIPSMAIFTAAVLAFPAAWRKRLLGVALGIPLLYAINVVRLACLGIIGAWSNGGPIFDFSHHYLWQGIYIVFVVAIWLIWVETVVRGRKSWPKTAQ